ncbi:MAG: hypothetical protein E7386_05905 [Ruminococcaceae bacterium]|nr:hypothetical protein [Oscillospiraceae bacterium]
MKSSAKGNQSNKTPLPSLVISLGKYLAKNLEGVSLPKRQPSNVFEFYVTIPYSIPEGSQNDMSKNTDGDNESTEKRIRIYFNLTTYGNLIRVNAIQKCEDGREPNLGQLSLPADKFEDLPACKEKLLDWAHKSIAKAQI